MDTPARGFQLGPLQEWLRDLRDFLASVTESREDHGGRPRLADTTDEGMAKLLARAMTWPPTSRWERAALRATIGLHATRLRDAGVSGEQGLARFKTLLYATAPLDPARADEQARAQREMVRWWVEAYYGDHP
jgi:hypothetical protein